MKTVRRKLLWEGFKEILADLFSIFAGGWIALHLILIAVYGSACITEQFSWILYTEIGLVTGLIVLGVERLIDDLRVKKTGAAPVTDTSPEDRPWPPPEE